MTPEEFRIRSLLQSVDTIAVVGSAEPRSGCDPAVLINAGYRVVPVTSAQSQVLGRRSFASLRDIPERVDVVDVADRFGDAAAIAREAAQLGVRALFLKSPPTSDKARRIAEAAGMVYVEGECAAEVIDRVSAMAPARGRQRSTEEHSTYLRPA